MSLACIFCLDTGNESLQYNISCPCLFRTHRTCWNQYILSKYPLTCPTCRKQITPKLQTNPPLDIPVTPIVPTAPSSNDFILQEDIYISIPVEQSQSQSQPIRKKPTKVQACIIAFILVGFWIFVMKMFGIF